MTRPRWFDAAVCGLLGLAAQVEAWLGPYDQRALLSLVCLALTLPLAWRRVVPLPANLAVVGVFAAGQAVLGDLTEMATGTLPLLVAAYTVAAVLPLRAAALAGAAALTAALLSVVSDPSPSSFTYAGLVVCIAWGVGRVVAARHAQVRQLTREAERLRQEQEAQARVAVEQERGRIARELHDVVAHSVSLMVVQAGAAEGVVRRDPDAAEAALRTVQDSGRQALVELRRMLDLLRDEAPQGDDLTPQPGIRDLPRLVLSAQAAGLQVALMADEGLDPPPAVSLTAYRIVQESLTNALKHAGPTAVDVELRQVGDAVRIVVRDRGLGVAAPGGAGHGLVGMRERVALFGGTLDVRTAPGKGFAITALLPMSGSA